MSENITVEVAYGTPEKQLIKTVEIVAGQSAMDAVVASDIVKDFPEIDVSTAKMGIFGKSFSPKQGPELQILKAGDRVEIYRPLIADPKEARRKRAAKSAE